MCVSVFARVWAYVCGLMCVPTSRMSLDNKSNLLMSIHLYPVEWKTSIFRLRGIVIYGRQALTQSCVRTHAHIRLCIHLYLGTHTKNEDIKLNLLLNITSNDLLTCISICRSPSLSYTDLLLRCASDCHDYHSAIYPRLYALSHTSLISSFLENLDKIKIFHF